ncbi:MAG TPA: hypothetical protein VIF15_08540 [Polyangiaceae bacterium]|jgi:hypothetical protein
MRQRLMHVLESDDQDELTSEVLRRFWTRAKPLPARTAPDSARVVDLAQWARTHHGVERR